MDKEWVSTSIIYHTIIEVIKLNKLLNSSILKGEHVAIGLSFAFEPWLRETYRSKETIYSERTAFSLPKASPLMV